MYLDICNSLLDCFVYVLKNAAVSKKVMIPGGVCFLMKVIILCFSLCILTNQSSLLSLVVSGIKCQIAGQNRPLSQPQTFLTVRGVHVVNFSTLLATSHIFLSLTPNFLVLTPQSHLNYFLVFVSFKKSPPLA